MSAPGAWWSRPPSLRRQRCQTQWVSQALLYWVSTGSSTSACCLTAKHCTTSASKLWRWLLSPTKTRSTSCMPRWEWLDHVPPISRPVDLRSGKTRWGHLSSPSSQVLCVGLCVSLVLRVPAAPRNNRPGGHAADMRCQDMMCALDSSYGRDVVARPRGIWTGIFWMCRRQLTLYRRVDIGTRQDWRVRPSCGGFENDWQWHSDSGNTQESC